MVKLEEVPDEELLADQAGPIGTEEDWDDTDTESDLSDTLSDAGDETIYERLAALKDIIPPQSRQRIASTFESAYSWASSSLVFSGKALWVVSSSALLVGVPWALAYAEEQQLVEMEREMKMQQSANELLTPGASMQQQPGQGKAGL